MGVLFFLVFIVGLYIVAEEFAKGTRERQRELDSMRSEDERNNRRLIWWDRGYEFHKKKK